MQELFFYLVKMTACSMVLLLYYFLFLRNKPFHQYNRFYLLLAVLISFVLPLIEIPVLWQADSAHPPLYIQTLQAITITNHIDSNTSCLLSHPSSMLIALYLIVFLFIVSRLVISIIKIRALSRKYCPLQSDKIVIYHTNEKNAPFSFMNKIFCNDRITIDSPEGKRIFRHELYHAQQLHSIDNIFMQTALSIAWFNPFFHIIKREITITHEFLADRFAVQDSDRYAYAEYLVVHAANRADDIPVAHYFFKSPVKRRIAMILQHSNNSRFSHLRKLLAIPLTALILCSLAMQTSRHQLSDNISNKLIADTTGPQVVSKPETDAQYPGGQQAWIQYLIKTLRYPQQAQDKEVQGPVVVEFIVDKTGSTRDFKAISGPAEGGLREEAIRVLQNSGNWIPGKDHGQVAVTVKRQPIIFRLEKQ